MLNRKRCKPSFSDYICQNSLNKQAWWKVKLNNFSSIFPIETNGKSSLSIQLFSSVGSIGMQRDYQACSYLHWTLWVTLLYLCTQMKGVLYWYNSRRMGFFTLFCSLLITPLSLVNNFNSSSYLLLRSDTFLKLSYIASEPTCYFLIILFQAVYFPDSYLLIELIHTPSPFSSQ